MSRTIRIADTDTAVPAEDGDTVLDALLLDGVGFAYSCQAGNCGTCRCELVDGDVMELEYSEHALTPQERARGIVLACRTQVWSDVTIRRLPEDELVMHPSRVMQCRVEAVDALAPSLWRVRAQIVSGGPFTFSAGQYATLEFPFAPAQPRDYSIASRPDEPWLEFHVRESGGLTADLARRLTPGSPLRVSGPNGTAYLREKHVGPVLAIAGGSGFAPIRSIVSTLRAKALAQPVHAYFGVRGAADLHSLDEIAGWVAGRGDSFAHAVVEDAAPGSGHRGGRVTDAIAQDFGSLAGFKAYVAGPPAMVESTAALLLAKGVALRDIHTDHALATDATRAAA
jgi:CDP-4-dehydro-6-deoxyglucose reductase/ferredoxin-NAD(P)+ reductase (naphthalene dioxygenase ferredoxin-specific)